MQNTYKIYCFRYRLFSNGKKFTHALIYARERATADKITQLAIEAWGPRYSFKPSFFHFKKLMTISVPPYEYEQSVIRHFERLIEKHKLNIK